MARERASSKTAGQGEAEAPIGLRAARLRLEARAYQH